MQVSDWRKLSELEQISFDFLVCPQPTWFRYLKGANEAIAQAANAPNDNI